LTAIVRFDNSCKIIDETDLEIFEALDKELSFMLQGAEFSAAYQGYFNEAGEFVTWDGKRHLLQSNGKFPVGLLPRVQEFFAIRGKNVTIIDQRTPKQSVNSIDISGNLSSIGKNPRPYQVLAVERAVENDRGVIRLATGGGKCGHKDSLIVSEYGLLTYEELLGDLKLGDQEACKMEISIATSNKFGTRDKTSMIYHDGYGDSKKIITSYGFENTITPDHKIQVMSETGNVVWKKCKDLEVNDFVAISYGNKLFGNQDMDLDDAYWYGLLFGDGSLTLDGTVAFTNMDEHLLKFSKNYLVKIGQKFLERKTKSKATNINIHDKIYRDRLLALGFEKEKSTQKVIPKLIRSLKKEPLAMFIRGLYETDGWIGIEKSKPTICIGLSNKKAIDQLHLLLLNFGIIASRRVKKTTHEDSHILTIYRSSISAFIENIGLDPNGKKYHALNCAMDRIGVKNDNSYIPNQSIRLKNLLKDIPRSKFNDSPVKWNTIRSWIGDKHWRNPSRNNLISFLNWMVSKNLNVNEANGIFKDIDGVFFDKITSIKNTKSDNYDFVVPETHSFISQGFVNHNTLVAALIAAKLGKPTIVYVIGKDLLYQLQEFFKKVFQTDIGIIGDGKCEIHDINVATVWSVGQALGLEKNSSLDDSNDKEKKMDPGKFRKIKQMLLDCSVHIMDECHLAACDTVQTIARHIKAEYVYGMSASPWRDDGADLLIEAFLGRKVVDISARELIDSGYLVEPNIRFLAPKTYKFKTGKYPKIYSNYIVENEQRNGMIVKGAVKMVEQGFVPLVLFHTIKHGDILFDELKKNVSTALLSGKDNSKIREKIKGELEDGKIKCLVASKIFDIGVDLPILSGLVIAGAGKSSVRALQRIGRVIRPYPGKTMSAVLDFFDQAPYLTQHAEIRKSIYETEFNVQVPKKKSE
jgi:superfamily II DNA or RNA helicase/intein/homing endonuclease